jgi:iron complex transport system ATP-binding protein
MTTLQVRHLTVEIGSAVACHDLSLIFNPGEVWSVLGRNGVGKSTLLSTLAGLRPAAVGTIVVEGVSLDRISRRKRAQTIGILFQDQDPTFPATVLETALAGRHPWLSLFEGERESDIEMALETLKQLDLDGMEQRELWSLSGGERRRVDLATLFLQQTRVMLLDEPVNHLDLHYQVEVMGQLIRTWQQQGSIVIMVMHDVNLAMRFSDHLLLLFGNGESHHGDATDLATEENFSRLYGHPLRRYPANGQQFFVPA